MPLGTSASENKLDKLHLPLIVSTAIICTLGVINLISATRNAATPLWHAQAVAMVIGAIAITVSLFVDYRWLSTLAWPAYGGTVLLLLGVVVAGKKVLGARRWLAIGRFQLQPSELLKIAIILLLARWFSRDETGVRQGHYRLRDLFFPALFALIPIVLVMKQPDLGTALVTLFIAFTMVLFAKVRLRDLLMLAAGSVVIVVVAWNKFLKQYQKDRIWTFLDPQAFAKTKGYHSIQSIIAVGSGQWSGKGWGEGTQNQLRFLPEQHTDFIFSVWAEEHGFVACFVLVALYTFLVLAALDVAANARDKFGSFLCIGVASLFFWHAFINIGMVIGVLPVVGVPLPLFSYGGTSVVVDLLGVGMLLNVSLRRFMF
ncbi:MAG: rod shape-determining protein RodA [Deltaproteobacteria bacterium]|nr:rod shape-determining protein RodA [Deltaproteobacteria bacterium]